MLQMSFAVSYIFYNQTQYSLEQAHVTCSWGSESSVIYRNKTNYEKKLFICKEQVVMGNSLLQYKIKIPVVNNMKIKMLDICTRSSV